MWPFSTSAARNMKAEELARIEAEQAAANVRLKKALESQSEFLAGFLNSGPIRNGRDDGEH